MIIQFLEGGGPKVEPYKLDGGGGEDPEDKKPLA